MTKNLLTIDLTYITISRKKYDIPLSYQLFGKELFSAPIILVNHALTGNSLVTGEEGWWKNLIGVNQIIDTKKYTILCFNIPGNGYNDFLIDQYEDFTVSDIANIFLLGLQHLKISKLHTIIGGSLGGAIGWEMLCKKNALAQEFIPIACDYKTHDWLNAQCMVQKFLLNEDQEPLQKARLHAMLCYRTPESLNSRFNNSYNVEKKKRESEVWLSYHGEALNGRFSLKAYRLMNHLLMTININKNQLKKIKANINMISINSDLFFPASEIRQCYDDIKEDKKNTFYDEIDSIHGHDAFLIEYEQLNTILKPIFN